jgi:hypothetical protein
MIPLLFLISYRTFKDLLSSFISSIIKHGEIAVAAPINYLSLDKAMKGLSFRNKALSFLNAKYLKKVPRLDPSIPLTIQF